jgi:hypothetical protein
LPYWLAGVAGLLAYRWMPFGGMDLGFRFQSAAARLGITDALVVFTFALVVAVPVAWGAAVVRRAEGTTWLSRSPELRAMAGGLVFATMALGSKYVLFSGQQGFQALPSLGTGEVTYLVVAKWLALVIALAAGWRGGPVFPMFFSAGALAVLVADVIETPTDLVMIAAVASVSAVFLRGNVVAAFVLSLYVVPLTYAIVILVGALGGATGRSVAGSLRLIPPDPDPSPAGTGEPPPA